ncbi:Aste57867_7403 [Aphanomyces stellatus]|uniref:Aste57867_7403 protein n=1 Tax=Aphanomyces stellatus TaxID=120398 RepID=A0A485KIA7_9STRA|nr:hypothetical protein As57867_007377 [Aphanomyces stellatus]VFT84318.1 Aste57867_7403 [Aphanomyces stellatus]
MMAFACRRCSYVNPSTDSPCSVEQQHDTSTLVHNQRRIRSSDDQRLADLETKEARCDAIVAHMQSVALALEEEKATLDSALRVENIQLRTQVAYLEVKVIALEQALMAECSDPSG